MAEPDQPSEAERGGGEGGGDRARPGAVPGAGGEPVRPAGHPHHQAQPVPHVLLHEAPEHRRSSCGGVSSSPSTYLGHHISVLRTGHFVQVGEIPTGCWDVRLHLHAGSDVRRQVFGDLSATSFFAQEKRPFLCHMFLGAEPALQRPADVHFLPERGRRGRIRGV